MIRLRAPAKLNLYLRVLGRRSDGYHELETLLERIDLADELTFTPAPGGMTLTCDEPALDCGSANLVTQAATLLQQACRTAQGAAIRLAKRIPIAAGLGGGSSDAATTLFGLNRLWQLGLQISKLCELGAQLGSDVPFFLEEAVFAIGRGRGERCEPLAGRVPSLWHVLVIPDERLSTKEVYEGFDRQESVLTEPTASVTMCAHALCNGPDLAGLAKGLRNDLAPEAIRRCPAIRDIQHALHTAGCVGVGVSGSGPSVFGLCRDAPQAHHAARAIQHDSPPAWRILVVKTNELTAPPWSWGHRV